MKKLQKKLYQTQCGRICRKNEVQANVRFGASGRFGPLSRPLVQSVHEMNARFDENDGDVQALTKRERRNGRTGLRERGKGFSSSYQIGRAHV